MSNYQRYITNLSKKLGIEPPMSDYHFPFLSDLLVLNDPQSDCQFFYVGGRASEFSLTVFVTNTIPQESAAYRLDNANVLVSKMRPRNLRLNWRGHVVQVATIDELHGSSLLPKLSYLELLLVQQRRRWQACYFSIALGLGSPVMIDTMNQFSKHVVCKSDLVLWKPWLECGCRQCRHSFETWPLCKEWPHGTGTLDDLSPLLLEIETTETEIVMQQTGCSWDKAQFTIFMNRGDIVDAIMDLTAQEGQSS